MSKFELPKEPKFYDYESPITRVVKEATETMMKQEEAECMVTITREVGYSVDKNELIKALNYDREQYDKGYRDGVRETFKAELEEIKAEIEEIRMEEPLMSRGFECYGFKDKTPEDIKTEVIELLENRIAELKGENNE